MLSERHSTRIVLPAALELAERGIHVFPCRPRSKLPATAHGVLDSSTDPEQIRKWFENNPDLNLATRCGAISGLFTIDVDPRNCGVESITTLIRTHGALSEDKAPTVLTGGGGFHFLLKSPRFPVTRKALAPGVDVIGENRYALSPPSLHESGSLYRWKHGYSLADLDFPVAASWVLEQLKTTASSTTKNLHHSGVCVEEGARDLYLISYCGQKIAQGLTEQEVYLLVFARNEEVCRHPFPEDELIKLVDHALKKYTKPGISGNRFKPAVYAHELTMRHRPITYRGITLRCSEAGNDYEIWDSQAIKREIYALSERTLAPKEINVVLELLRLESHVENLAQVPRVKEKDFTKQCLERNTGTRTYLHEIYSSYEQWCRRNCFSPVSQADLRRLLEYEFGINAKRLTGGAYGFTGIRVRENPMEEKGTGLSAGRN